MKALTKGDTIGIFSPGFYIKHGSLNIFKGVARNFGLKVKPGKHIYKRSHHFAGTPEQRAEDFNSFIKDKKVKMVVASRGGYGCNQIAELIDYPALKRNPKIIVGYSDFSYILNSIYNRTGLITFYGPSASTMSRSGIKNFINMFELFMNAKGQEFHFNIFKNVKVINFKTVKGISLPFCLSILQTVIGTKWEPDWRGRILFLEDTDEAIYQIDRILAHLKASKVFEKINGAVFNFTNLSKEKKYSDYEKIETVIKKNIARKDIPVILNFPFGHSKVKKVIPLGARCRITKTKIIFSNLFN